MRGAFGLVSLLLCIAIMAYVWSMHTSEVSRSSKEARQKAQQISGRDEDGKPALDSILTMPETVRGKFQLNVTRVDPGGAFDKVYGLRVGDRITVAGQFPLDMYNDEATARSMLLMAYQSAVAGPTEPGARLTVIRNGKEMTLTQVTPPGTPTATNTPPAPAQPSTPVQPPSQGKVIQNQINDIKKQLGQPPQ